MDTVRYRRNDHYQNKQVSKRPRLLFNEETIGKKIHKFYLTIALFFGVILSIRMEITLKNTLKLKFKECL